LVCVENAKKVAPVAGAETDDSDRTRRAPVKGFASQPLHDLEALRQW
jgi:hypothetical protein